MSNDNQDARIEAAAQVLWGEVNSAYWLDAHPPNRIQCRDLAKRVLAAADSVAPAKRAERVCGFGIVEPAIELFGETYGVCAMRQECPAGECGYVRSLRARAPSPKGE